MSSHVHLILFVQKETALSDIMRDFEKFIAYKIRKQLEEDRASDLLDSLRIKGYRKVTPETTGKRAVAEEGFRHLKGWQEVTLYTTRNLEGKNKVS